jgi:hypothetical protein
MNGGSGVWRLGRQALAQQPDTIKLVKATGAQWSDPRIAEWLSKPLREKGFADLGIHHVVPLIDFKLGVIAL